MVDAVTVYLAVTGALLLVALAVGPQGLARIFREAGKRRRKRHGGWIDATRSPRLRPRAAGPRRRRRRIVDLPAVRRGKRGVVHVLPRVRGAVGAGEKPSLAARRPGS